MKISDYLRQGRSSPISPAAATGWPGARSFTVTWAGILAVFWMVDTWTNPLTIILAVVLLAGRQLGPGSDYP